MDELKAELPPAEQLLVLKRPAVLIVIFLIIAAIVRFAFVSADLPLSVSRAQDDVYNAAWYVQDAQYIVQGRQVLYDEGTFKLLWTGYFTAVFFLLGVGTWQANAGAALLGIAWYLPLQGGRREAVSLLLRCCLAPRVSYLQCTRARLYRISEYAPRQCCACISGSYCIQGRGFYGYRISCRWYSPFTSSRLPGSCCP